MIKPTDTNHKNTGTDNGKLINFKQADNAKN